MRAPPVSGAGVWIPRCRSYPIWTGGRTLLRWLFAVSTCAATRARPSEKSIRDLGHRPLWPDAADALHSIARTRRIAVLSNADDAYLTPVVVRIPADFAAVISSESARCYKPAAGIFAAAVAALRANPQECAYVGDRQFEDVQGARSAGMAAVWLNRLAAPADPTLPPPDAEIRSLRELPRHSRPPPLTRPASAIRGAGLPANLCAGLTGCAII